MPHRILHVITGLTTGGAELALQRLLSQQDRDRFSARVISLTSFSPVGDLIEGNGIGVTALGMRFNDPRSFGLSRLVREIRRIRPALIQTWCYHADLLGGLAGRLAGIRHIVWGIHNSTLHPQHSKATTRLIQRICCQVSGWVPERIICCSEASRRIHAAQGCAGGKMVVVPNGVDVERFRPDPEARHAVRQALGLPSSAVLVGHLARFDPQKDHRTFLRAAGLARQALPEVHYVLCGAGVTGENATLAGWVREAGLEGRCHLLGRRDDMPQIMASLDLLALSSSYGEAFPLVLCEAMAAGVPCVSTDVGDSALIVADTGRVVAPEDPEAFAGAMRAMLALEPGARRALGAAARRRMEVHYRLPNMVDRYQRLWETTIAGGAG